MNADSFKHYTAEQCHLAIKLLQERLRFLTNPGPQEVIEQRIFDLPLPIRVLHALNHAGFKTVEDILVYGVDQLGYLRGIGPKSLAQIQTLLSQQLNRQF